MTTSSTRWRVSARTVILLTAAVTLSSLTATNGQTIIFERGQNVVPAFEGWEQNPDGTFDLIFGYMNRNSQEKVHIPIGRTISSRRVRRIRASRPSSSRAATATCSASRCRPTSGPRKSPGR